MLRRVRHARAGACAVVATLVLATVPAAGRSDSIAIEPATDSMETLIARGTRYNADGDYDAAARVWKEMEQKHPAHPAPHVYAVDTLYWRMIYDDSDTRYDDEIAKESRRAIEKGERWLEKSPDDVEGHYYVGQAYMHLGRVYGIRAKIYRAGREAERARHHLERALELDPELVDARYQLGMYNYYASLVPDVFQWLSFLWFVPSGDRETGLLYLDEVRRNGKLNRFAAAFYLSNIRAYHPKSRDRPFALKVLRELHADHPHNTLVHFELIEALAMADLHEEVVAQTLLLEENAKPNREDQGRATMARVWRARSQMELDELEEARDTLAVFGPDGPDNPDWAARWVMVTRGQILDLLGDRPAALEQYERVVGLELRPELSRATRYAQAGIAEPFTLEGDPARVSRTGAQPALADAEGGASQ